MAVPKEFEQACLKNFLIRCNYWYYVRAEPLITDYEYDMEFKRLQKLEDETGHNSDDSPTQTPGSDSAHSYPDWAKVALTGTLQEAKIQVVDDGSH